MLVQGRLLPEPHWAVALRAANSCGPCVVQGTGHREPPGLPQASGTKGERFAVIGATGGMGLGDKAMSRSLEVLPCRDQGSCPRLLQQEPRRSEEGSGNCSRSKSRTSEALPFPPGGPSVRAAGRHESCHPAWAATALGKGLQPVGIE